MRLTVLGCSGSLPGPSAPASSYMVEAGDTRVVVDLGSGALSELQRRVGYERLDEIDAVLISHLHPDHYMDLCGYYVALRYGPKKPRRRVPVWGPENTAQRLATAYGDCPDPEMADEFDFHAFPETADGFTIGPLSVRVARVAHPVTAYAMRFEHAGGSFVYSGDTGPTPALVDLARDADMLLCEAAFREGGDNPPNLHMTGRQAGEHAHRAGVRRLVITHVPPWGDADLAVAEAQTSFDGPVDAAQVGATWDL